MIDLMQHIDIRCGDVRKELRKLPSESVHTVVTSPPYWRLRDYGFEGQIGLEKTPKDFIQSLVKVFRQVRRVLRSDGTCWVNMGDAHVTSKIHQRGFPMKAKMMMPHRLAIALQDDGWYVRQDIVWYKQQPQPETVSDRPTTAHEYLFLLSKSEQYWYDADAIAEQCSEKTNARSAAANALRDPALRDQGGVNAKIRMTSPAGWATNSTSRTAVEHSRTRGTTPKQNESFASAMSGTVSMRNKRSVWPVYTDRMDLKLCTHCKTVYKSIEFAALPLRIEEVGDRKVPHTTCTTCSLEDGWLSHFAAFGAEWIEPAVLAGCPAHTCPTCGVPAGTDDQGRLVLPCACATDIGVYYTPKTVAGIVADIFAGTGTTAGVAVAHGRRALLIEGSADYVHLIPHRVEQVVRRLRKAPAPPTVAPQQQKLALV